MLDIKEYDVFISHAWEDKEDFVRPLAECLIALGLKVWIDELSLEIGDSLRENIDLGLKASRYGIVVLSPAFFSKSWPPRELNGLVQRAMIENRKVILPIWHEVDHKMVAAYSMPLADLVAAKSEFGAKYVAAEIERVVRRGVSTPAPIENDMDKSVVGKLEVTATTPDNRNSKMGQVRPIHEERAEYSMSRLEELRGSFSGLEELAALPGLAIFATGSYARLEASEYSDVDLFFVSSEDPHELTEPRTKSLRLFGKIVEIVDRLKYPKFSNDCQYLVLLHSSDILKNLGSPTDDHENYFTARMLLMLEGHCLYGDDNYTKLTTLMIQAYFQDYPDHSRSFQPVFLMNDICRYWKTLLLNYEHKRRPCNDDSGEVNRTKQKVKNFKLKYSRMTTCFATIGALGSHMAPVTEEQVLELTQKTPRQRIESISDRLPSVASDVQKVLSSYNWFLEMTGQPTAELEDHFSDKQKRTEMFQKANSYGDAMYALLQKLDMENDKLNLLRYMVI